METLTTYGIDASTLDSTSVGVGGVVGMIMGLGAAFFVVALIVGILTIIAMWKIFTKAGEAGWKSIIPIYNAYILFKICWETKYFWILFLVAFLGGFLSGLIPAIATVVTIIAGIIEIVIYIILDVKLAKAFGKGTGFAVGIVLLNTIFTLILGFGSSTYVGKESANA